MQLLLQGEFIIMTSEPHHQLLRQTLASYWVGRSKFVGQSPLDKLESSNESKVNIHSLPQTDRLLINKFENARSRGVLAARQRDLNTAEKFFAQARLLLDANLLSEEGHLYYQSYIEQGEAFLDCRHGNFEKARDRTLKSLEIDQKLEDVYGHSYLILHRIQQVHNSRWMLRYIISPRELGIRPYHLSTLI
jgi:hypothetical protein